MDYAHPNGDSSRNNRGVARTVAERRQSPTTPLLSFLSSSGESRSGQNLQNRTSYFFLDVENTPEELSRIKKVGLLIEQPLPSAASTQDQNEK